MPLRYPCCPPPGIPLSFSGWHRGTRRKNHYAFADGEVSVRVANAAARLAGITDPWLCGWSMPE
ncbi:MAG: hypothetical protein ACI80V_002180 [Rhodothermales bacterium]|jgi:hypothetical protein